MKLWIARDVHGYGSESTILGVFATREKAKAACREWSLHGDGYLRNPQITGPFSLDVLKKAKTSR